MTQVTSTALALFTRGMGDTINLFPDGEDQEWQAITPNVVPLSDLYDERVMLGGMGTAGKMQEAGGIPYDNITAPYTKKYYLDIYGIGFECSKQSLQKKGGAVLRAPAKFMGFSIYDAQEQLVADIMNNAQSSSYTGIDGVALASASHPTSSGTNWSNLSTAATLSIDALETMLQDQMNHKTYRDQYWSGPGKSRLVVPRQLGMLAKRLLKGVEQPQTQDREKQVAGEDIIGVAIVRRLTSATRYALIPAQASKNPLRLYSGGPVDMDNDKDIDKPSLKFTATKEMAVAWDNPIGTQFNAGA